MAQNDTCSLCVKNKSGGNMLLEQASHAALNVHQTLSALEASVPLDFSMQLNDRNMAGEKRKEKKKKKKETKKQKKKHTHCNWGCYLSIPRCRRLHYLALSVQRRSSFINTYAVCLNQTTQPFADSFLFWRVYSLNSWFPSPPPKKKPKDHRRRRDTALKAVSYRLQLTDLHVQPVRMHAPQLTKDSPPETNSHKLWGVYSHTQYIQLVLAQAVKLCLLFCFFCYTEKNGVVASPWWWCYTVQLMAPEKLHFQGTAVQSRYSWQRLHGDNAKCQETALPEDRCSV